jgi:hypothetical protein
MIQVISGGTCKICRRDYEDRVWAEDEYVRQNGAAVRLKGEAYIRQEWHRMRATHFALMQGCPLNCKWIVHFSAAKPA